MPWYTGIKHPLSKPQSASLIHVWAALLTIRESEARGHPNIYNIVTMPVARIPA